MGNMLDSCHHFPLSLSLILCTWCWHINFLQFYESDTVLDVGQTASPMLYFDKHNCTFPLNVSSHKNEHVIKFQHSHFVYTDGCLCNCSITSISKYYLCMWNRALASNNIVPCTFALCMILLSKPTYNYLHNNAYKHVPFVKLNRNR